MEQVYSKMLHMVGVLNYYSLRPMFQYMNQQCMNNLVGCEIGCYQGKNALNVLNHCGIQKFYLIEPVEERVLKQRFKKYEDKIQFIFDYSYNVADCFLDGSLDFVYIDGDHSYASVKNDINLFVSKVRKGGVIGGHDFNNYEVALAVVEYFGNKNIMTSGFATDWWIQT